MKSKLHHDWPLWVIILLPFMYLAILYPNLPESVPLHWNQEGEVDRYGPKAELWIIPFVLPLLVYLIFLLVPLIDPKQKLDQMGVKFSQLKFWLTLFMSVLALVIINMAASRDEANTSLVFGAVGLLYTILGNYFKTIKPNYFIGLRTPWTLENEQVWKVTHQFAGKYWFAGGLILMVCSFLLEPRTNFYLTMGITLLIVVIPTYYSYKKFQEFKKKKQS